MTYKNTVAAGTELPTTGVAIGDTYVAAPADTNGYITITNPAMDGDIPTQSTVKAYAGDLIIATAFNGAVEVNGALPAGSILWEVVRTGYDETLQPRLEIQSTTDSNIATITVKSATDKALGTFSIEAEEGMKVELQENTIKIGMEWSDWTVTE